MSLENITANQKLEQILLNFIEVLRINILIVTPNGKPVMVPKTMGYGFFGASQWGVFKSLGNPEFLSKFESEGVYLKHVDIFGFQSFAIPIPIGEDNFGYLIVGPVIVNKGKEQSIYEKIAKEAGVGFSDFLENLNEVRTVTFNTLKSILDLLFELSRYALRMNDNQLIPPDVKKDEAKYPDTLFSNLLDLVMTLTQAECGSIMLFNKETNELSMQISKGIQFQKTQQPVKLEEGIAGLAVLQKESFVINGKHSNNRVQQLLKKPDLKCSVILPIVKRDNEVLGVINISTRQNASRLATNPKEMLKSMREITTGTLSSFL